MFRIPVNEKVKPFTEFTSKIILSALMIILYVLTCIATILQISMLLLQLNQP